MLEHFQEDGINKQAKFQGIYIYIYVTQAENREGKNLRIAEKS